MIRATTPTHKFIFTDINPSTFKEINVYYAQQGVEILKKTKADCTITSRETEVDTEYIVSYTLTQQETKLFKPKGSVKIQLRILTLDNRALATPEYEVPIFDVINDEVLE